jgi:hypothetical protein
MGVRGLVFLLLTRTPLKLQAQKAPWTVARRRALTKRQSAKGTPALAYEHHQAWSERLCTGTLTTPPSCARTGLRCRPGPGAVYCLARSPVLRAHAPVCLHCAASSSCAAGPAADSRGAGPPHISAAKEATQACGRCT